MDQKITRLGNMGINKVCFKFVLLVEKMKLMIIEKNIVTSY